MFERHLDAQRPDSVLDDCGPRFGEYPVSLLTRRTLGLRADKLLEQRHTAPGRIRLGRTALPPHDPGRRIGVAVGQPFQADGVDVSRRFATSRPT